MPLERVLRKEPLTKAEFHSRLREWLDVSSEAMIGSTEVDERTPWVYVRTEDGLFGLHADTKRESVSSYLQQVSDHGDDLPWTLTKTQRGLLKALLYGPERVRIKSFYLYLQSKT